MKIIICDKDSYKSNGFYYLLKIDDLNKIPVFRLNQDFIFHRLSIKKGYVSYDLFMQDKICEFETEESDSLAELHVEVIRRFPELWL